MQAFHRVAKNTGILYARMVITVFISLVATRLVLNALGAADFGLFNLVGGVIAMLGFLNNSMATATQRFISYAQGEGDLEKVKRIFNMSIILHAGIAVLMVLVLEIAGHFFFNGILNISQDRLEIAIYIYQFMVVSTFFTVLSVPYEAVITAHENMLFYAILGIIESLLKLGIAWVIADSVFDHLAMYGLLMATASILLLLSRQIYCHYKYPECVLAFNKYYEKNLMKEISSFAGWSLIGSASSMFAAYGQGIVINVFFGTLINAAQGIANQVSGQLGGIAGTMQKALNPMIDKSEGAGNRQLLLKASMLGSKLSFFLLMLTFTPVLIEMQFIFKIWLKDVPDCAILFCRLLLIRNLIEQSYTTLTAAIVAVGNIKSFQVTTSVFNVLPLIITYLLFYNGFAPYYLYITFIIYSVVQSMIVIYFTKVKCGMSISQYLRQVILKCFVSFIMVFFSSAIPRYLLNESYTRLFCVVITASLISWVVVWLYGFTKEEKLILYSLKQGIFNKIGFRK
jgi:O-antigen/teichoic acid export membrane protein